MSSNEFDQVVDKGLEGVPVCSTDISTIKDSVLYLRGYTLEDLVEHSSYLEVAYLLWEGNLPSSQEKEKWEKEISNNLSLSSKEQEVLKHLPFKQVNTMAWLRTAVSTLALLESKEPAPTDREALKQAGFKFLVKTPLLVTFFHSLRTGKPFVEPRKDKGLAWNFLYTLTGQEPSAEAEKVFDVCLILHADHDLNCSTFSARVTSSSLSDVFSALVSAIGTLKGPLHGGANEQVMKMLSKFSNPKEAEDFVDQAFAKKEKIMGFGHRVYKEKDPRAEILKKFSKKLTQEQGSPELFSISQAMEDKIREKKGLCPNVDFYSASVYHCLGLPTDLFTPVFAVSRMAGWLAHIFEQYSKNRIYRPQSKWLGSFDNQWKPIKERS